MSRRTVVLLPKHRMLRRTLYGLLLAAPLLPGGLACGDSDPSGSVDAWAQERLSTAQRERLRQARQDALTSLGEEVDGHQPPEVLIHEAGLPSREQARDLFQGLSSVGLQA